MAADADEQALVQHLQGTEELCPGCGYSLLGLGTVVCPECGRRFRAADMGRRPRAEWVVFATSGRGWWTCVVLLGPGRVAGRGGARAGP
jgi:hypothetical protein